MAGITKRTDIAGNYVMPVVIVNESGSFRASFYSSAALESGSIIKSSPGTLYSVQGYNSGAAKYIQIHDRTGSMTHNAVPDTIIKAASDSNFTYDGGRFGVPFDSGIVIVNCPTASIFLSGSGANETWYNVSYK